MTDVLIITPPFSPHDTSPPLGPAVLAAHLVACGISCRQLDLNILFLRLFAGTSFGAGPIVGDHAKDRGRVATSRRFFRSKLHLPHVESTLVPGGVDAVLGLPHGFDDMAAAVSAMLSDPFWRAFVGGELHHVGPTPRILGLSIMGPAQVLPAVLTARLARSLWPEVLIVCGGSHVTLLADEIAADSRYDMGVFDAFLPHHSEWAFASMCQCVLDGDDWRSVPGVVVAGRGDSPAPPSTTGWLPPAFETPVHDLYGPTVSLPLQLERGCSYGRCTFCTYPAVEASAVRLTANSIDLQLCAAVAAGATRVSVKDSLMSLKSMRAFGEQVAKAAPGLQWSATTKVVSGLATHAAELTRHGCSTIELGIETIHPRLQRLIDKPQPMSLVESVIDACAAAGIRVVLNLLYGLPGETRAEAQVQLAWFERLVRRHPGLVHGSHNLVEVNRAAPFATRPGEFGIELGPVGPWAFSYCWDAPRWRADFKSELDRRVKRARREVREAA